jgi:hypothetical protein
MRLVGDGASLSCCHVRALDNDVLTAQCAFAASEPRNSIDRNAVRSYPPRLGAARLPVGSGSASAGTSERRRYWPWNRVDNLIRRQNRFGREPVIGIAVVATLGCGLGPYDRFRR